MVSLTPAPATAKVASIFNLIAHNRLNIPRFRLNIAHKRLNIAHNRLNIPLTKSACKPKSGRADWKK